MRTEAFSIASVTFLDDTRLQGKSQIPNPYLRLHLAIPAAEEDRLVAELWSLGTLGIESVAGTDERAELWAYFGLPQTPVLLEIVQGLRSIAGAVLLGSREIPSRDWQSDFRARLKPFPVGTRWWIDPREPDVHPVRAPVNRRLLRIPARTAFGTGSHASTALLVEMMDGLQLTGKRVLDVGTGSGILAIVALGSGARQVMAFDIDPQAVFVARQTCDLNEAYPGLLAGGIGSMRIDSGFQAFDVILANVLPSRLRDDLEPIAGCLTPSGSMLLSGILDEQEAEIGALLAGLGLRLGDRRKSGEWIALRMERVRP